MATIQKRRNGDRSVTFMVTVRVKGFKSASKAFPDRDAAEEWAGALEAELKEQRARGGLRADVTQLTVADLVREYTTDPVVKARKAAADVVALLGWWCDHYGTVRVRELSVLTLRAARDRLSNSGESVRVAADGTRSVHKRAAATVNRHLSAMRAAVNWGRANGLLPATQVWPPGLMLREPRPRARFLTDAELARLFKASATAGPVLHAAVVVSVLSGLRRGELLRLRWADVDLDRATVRVQESKTDTPRAVYLPPPAVEALKALRTGCVVGIGKVFAFTDGTELDASLLVSRWKAIRRAAGLAVVRWHDLRHTAASVLLQAGATLPEVGHVLGHKSPAVTARYAFLVAGRELPAHAAVAKKISDALAAGQVGEQ